jgi:hypothetical protein
MMDLSLQVPTQSILASPNKNPTRNPAKLHKKKAPKKGREKETNSKDQSPGKQTAQKRHTTRR